MVKNWVSFELRGMFCKNQFATLEPGESVVTFSVLPSSVWIKAKVLRFKRIYLLFLIC